MKYADQIIKFGRVKPFFDKNYKFNTIDIETVDNDLFLFGYTLNKKHYTEFGDFYDCFHQTLIANIQTNHSILTWSRYDNTHLLKLILSKASKNDIKTILLRVGKITPIFEYKYKTFNITIVNIIKDSIIFKVGDIYDNKPKTAIIYNLKNLYDTDLETTAKNYGLDYYSKMGIEYHIIDKKRFKNDLDYKDGVIESNRLDNIVLLDIAEQLLTTFESISGKKPKSIFTNGSLARSYLQSQVGMIGSKYMNFNQIFKGRLRDGLLDYAMRTYHGGKIESYVLGFIPSAKVVDITSAYPYAMSKLPKMTNKVIHSYVPSMLEKYFYAFIHVQMNIKDKNLIHPTITENPINKSNISPYGFINTYITKIEYDYLRKKGIKVKVIDFYAIEHINEYPYKDLIDTLFNERLKNKESNPSLSQMYKIILNSMYGITYELTDMYTEIDGKIEWVGYRGGDYFNPVTASYITSYIRTYLSEVSHDIILNGGQVLLNMTDSIIYKGDITLDVISEDKILGKFDTPKALKNIYILGAGRYEYQDEFTGKFTIKNRGFSVSVKDKSFYSNLHLSGKISLPHRTFVTSFKATTTKYAYEKMGYLIDDTYKINPFNLGGKRLIDNYNVNLNTEYTTTSPVYLEKGILKNG